MKKPLTIVLLLAVLAAGGYGFWRVRHSGPAWLAALPKVESYGQRPSVFRDELKRERAVLKESPNDRSQLRKLAHLYQANGLSAEAKMAYDSLARTPPGWEAQDHYFLATLAQEEGDLERAKVELRETVKDAPDYGPAQLVLAEILFKTGQADEAEKIYRQVLQKTEDQPEALLGLSRIDLQKQADDEAIRLLENLLVRHPEQTSGAGLLAQVLARKGDTERAEVMRRWSQRQRAPDLIDPWLDDLWRECYDLPRLSRRFEDLMNSGQLSDAVPLLTRISQLDAKSWIPDLLRGWTEAQAKRNRTAAEAYAKALEKGANPDQLCPLIVKSLEADGRVAEADRVVKTWAKQWPDSVVLSTLFVDTAMRLGDTAAAEATLRRILEKDPTLYAPNMTLAKLLWHTPAQAEAVACLQRVVKIYPADVASRGQLAEYFLDTKDPQSAIELLEQVLAHADFGPVKDNLTKKLALAYAQLAEAKARENQWPQAVAQVDKAIKLVPNDPDLYGAKAVYSAQASLWPEAIGSLQKLNQMQPDNPTVKLSLGDMLYQAGQHDAARVQWSQAQKLVAPSDLGLTQALNARLHGPITPELFK